MHLLLKVITLTLWIAVFVLNKHCYNILVCNFSSINNMLTDILRIIVTIFIRVIVIAFTTGDNL